MKLALAVSVSKRSSVATMWPEPAARSCAFWSACSFLHKQPPRGNHETKNCDPLAASAIAGPTLAQNPPAQSRPNNSAINSKGENNANAPVAGRNSFTEGQAKSTIEDAGFSNVFGLQKDKDGVWRGKARKDGKESEVSLDFQGNVNPVK